MDPESPTPEPIPPVLDPRPLLIGWHRARVELSDEHSLDVRAVACPTCGVRAGWLCREIGDG